MRGRCTNPNNDRWDDYGGRGITIEPRWNEFENFYADMGEPPSEKHSLERIRNDEGYSKDNCKWATHTEQNRNKRVSRMITIGGITKCLSEWATQSPVAYKTIFARLKSGWDSERALTTPLLR